MSTSQPVSFESSVPDNLKGLVADWSSDVQTFKVRWSKAMMWIFLVSDTFIFGSFLIWIPAKIVLVLLQSIFGIYLGV